MFFRTQIQDTYSHSDSIKHNTKHLMVIHKNNLYLILHLKAF